MLCPPEGPLLDLLATCLWLPKILLHKAALLLAGLGWENPLAKAGKKLHQGLAATGESGCAGESALPHAPCAYSSHIQACAGRENS